MVTKTDSQPGDVLEIIGAVQNYDWGLPGSTSSVAKLSANNAGGTIDEAKPYAELWMGTHPSAPSTVKGDGKSLKEHLGKDLPFLFKVLSVAKALSIQAHPDVELAKDLHARDPKNYPDPNHKPEMTIALSPFEALCGFRPIGDIVKSLEDVPELRILVEQETISVLKEATDGDVAGKEALKAFFAQFIGAEQGLVKEAINSFVSRITSINRNTTELEELCLRLNSQYPGEVGCFCVFLFNYLTLAAGEAVFLAANEPHAYLSGECVECMALSDNVVRAGLTPKFRDVETLVKMLTYKTFLPQDLAMEASKLSGRPHSLLYKPPVPEFAVIRTTMSLGDGEKLITEGSEAIILAVKGDFTMTKPDGNTLKLGPGSILLQDKDTESTISCCSQEGLIFQAFSQQ